MKKALRCWTQGFLHPLLHLVKGGVAVDGTVLLHADAAELVGKGKVFVQLCFAELCQFFQCHAVTFQLPQKRADEAVACAGGVHSPDFPAGGKAVAPLLPQV